MFYGSLVQMATSRSFVNIFKGQITINSGFVSERLEHNSFKNVNQTGFSQEAITHFNIQVPSLGGEISGADLGLDD